MIMRDLTTFCLRVIALSKEPACRVVLSLSRQSSHALQKSLQYQILAAISIKCIEVDSTQAWRLMVFADLVMKAL